jgi:undecaprenyl pyrophosphate phosphatase UppP
MKINNDIKESFCPACVAIPLAMAGAGASVYGSKKQGEHKKMKNIMLCGGLSVTFISVLVAVYFLFIKKCSDCR